MDTLAKIIECIMLIMVVGIAIGIAVGVPVGMIAYRLGKNVPEPSRLTKKQEGIWEQRELSP